MSQHITIHQLAEVAGVSAATVSIVLNDRPLARRILPETRSRILALAERYHYHPNRLAKALKQQSTGIIGFVCGGIYEPYFSALCDALTTTVEQAGYRLMTMLTAWDFQKEMDALDLIYSKFVDGIIINSDIFNTDCQRLAPFRNPEIPLVALCEQPPADCCSLSSDYHSGMGELFQAIAGGSFKDIMILEIPGYPLKTEVCMEVGRRHGYEVRKMLCTKEDAGICSVAGQIAEDCPDLLIVPSDLLSMKLIPQLTARGIRIPDDLSLVSIDGSDFCNYYQPTLAAIHTDFTNVAKRAMAIVKQKIDGNLEFIHEAVPTYFCPGGSLKSHP